MKIGNKQISSPINCWWAPSPGYAEVWPQNCPVGYIEQLGRRLGFVVDDEIVPCDGHPCEGCLLKKVQIEAGLDDET